MVKHDLVFGPFSICFILILNSKDLIQGFLLPIGRENENIFFTIVPTRDEHAINYCSVGPLEVKSTLVQSLC